MPTTTFETLKYASNSLRDTVGTVVDTIAQNSQYHWDTLHITPVAPAVPTGFEGMPLVHSIESSPLIFVGIVALLFLPLFVFFSIKHIFKRLTVNDFQRKKPTKYVSQFPLA
ncbi:hypothetical protein FACS1894180_5360 [Bacteroidia bacterium]|nr:hypothetical protein FACS1894180_5360 [Bacteroidia bacterium]